MWVSLYSNWESDSLSLLENLQSEMERRKDEVDNREEEGQRERERERERETEREREWKRR